MYRWYRSLLRRYCFGYLKKILINGFSLGIVRHVEEITLVGSLVNIETNSSRMLLKLLMLSNWLQNIFRWQGSRKSCVPAIQLWFPFWSKIKKSWKMVWRENGGKLFCNIFPLDDKSQGDKHGSYWWLWQGNRMILWC